MDWRDGRLVGREEVWIGGMDGLVREEVWIRVSEEGRNMHELKAGEYLQQLIFLTQHIHTLHTCTCTKHTVQTRLGRVTWATS